MIKVLKNSDAKRKPRRCSMKKNQSPPRVLMCKIKKVAIHKKAERSW
jgi:hypothetical protein